jgi:hypothetical protein
MEFLRFFWDAVAAVDSTARELDEGERFPLCRPGALGDLFRRGGLSDVRCESIEIATEFTSFDDYWLPVLGKQGAAPAYLASLNEETQNRIRDALKARLVASTDGSIAMTARAWAVQGTVRPKGKLGV